jgi:carbonic anhydrase
MKLMSPSVALICGCAAIASISRVEPDAQQHAAPHWTYQGAEGPDHWAELDKAFSMCRQGHRQSPIDIREAKAADLPAIQFEYKPAPLHIVNNGHTVQINYEPGSYITVGARKYQLTQFHFHHPSEERINGQGFEMVAHLVHRASDGKLAVVAVLLDPGAEDQATANIWTHLPADEGPEQMLDAIKIDARGLLPTQTGYYTFSGSLTTPPCSEDVTWFVLKTPKHIAKSQADSFGKLYPNDARPPQPLYGREVLVSK